MGFWATSPVTLWADRELNVAVTRSLAARATVEARQEAKTTGMSENRRMALPSPAMVPHALDT
jgi:hypothetical protein